MAENAGGLLSGGLSDGDGGSLLTHGLAPSGASSDPEVAVDGDVVAYAAPDFGRDLTDDGPHGTDSLFLSLRAYTSYTVGQGNLTAAIATRLLQDGVCVKT